MENTTKKKHIFDLDPSDYEPLMKALGEPGYRARQLADWVFTRKVFHPDQMTNLSRGLRKKLQEELDFGLPEVVSRLDSPDGTSKFVLKSERGHALEVVLMRYKDRTSVCISSQVGCRLSCHFCQTGKMGFVRHLSRAEILSQYALAHSIIAQEGEGRRISHVVFMGMGEPLDNYEASVGAANVLIAPSGFGLSARQVTLSTSGLAPKIESLAKDTRAAFALSLHAPTDELRTSLMPINSRYPLDVLKKSLIYYQKETGQKITIEYILIKDVNCGIKQAKALVKFIHGLRVKVNLIPFNAHPGMPYQRPPDEEIRAFQEYLTHRSIPSPVRYSKGLGVSAACGQLAAKRQEDLLSVPKRSSLLVEPG